MQRASEANRESGHLPARSRDYGVAGFVEAPASEGQAPRRQEENKDTRDEWNQHEGPKGPDPQRHIAAVEQLKEEI